MPLEPITVAAITFAAAVAYDVIKELGKGIRGHLKQRSNAISAVTLAVTVTEDYLLHLDDGGEVNLKLQESISGLWEQAYNSLTPLFEDDLERIFPLRLKSTYWKSPETWSDEGIDPATMSLQSVRKYFEKYIRGTKREPKSKAASPKKSATTKPKKTSIKKKRATAKKTNSKKTTSKSKRKAAATKRTSTKRKKKAKKKRKK